MSLHDTNQFQAQSGAQLRPRALDRRARKLVARIQKNHGDAEAVEALGAHYAKLGDQASLANLMEGFGDTLDTGHAAAEAYLRAADAALMVGDRIRAEALYERALARDPSHSEALDRALRLAETAHDFEAMKRILTGVLRAADARGAAPAQLARLHFRLGQLYETHLDDPDRAAALYRIAIDQNPQFVNASAAARRLYAKAGNHAAVSVLYDFEIDATKVVDDKRALLLALAEHEQKQGNLDETIRALRRSYKLDPSDQSTLRKLADVLIARSELTSGEQRETDRKRAAEVFFQLGRAVHRADAPVLLLRALTLAPDHARAAALLRELHGHSAAHDEHAETAQSLHGGESQMALDQRATVQMPSPLLQRSATRTAPQSMAAGLSLDNAPERPTPAVLDANRTCELSTLELLPLRATPPALPTPLPDALATPTPPAAATPQPRTEQRRAVANRTSELSAEELIPLSLPPPVPETTGRAQIVAQLETDATRTTLVVKLSASSESNLYVDMSNRLVDGGVFVTTYQALPAGSAVFLTIELPGNLQAQAHGRVTLKRDSLDPFEDPAPGACIAFEALTQESLALLGRFAAKRPPALIDDN